MTTHISSIPISAPMWRGAPQESLMSIVDKLSSASYCFADDTTKEWSKGREFLQKAASLVNSLKLDHAALHALYTHKPQLLSFADFVNAVLKEARSK